MSSVITPILGHLSGLAQPVKSVDLAKPAESTSNLAQPVKSVDITKPAESTSTLTKAVKSVDQTKLAESTSDLTKAVKSGWRQGLFYFDDCTILSTPYCLIMYTLLFANNCGLFVVAAKQNNCLYRDLTEPVKSILLWSGKTS